MIAGRFFRYRLWVLICSNWIHWPVGKAERGLSIISRLRPSWLFPVANHFEIMPDPFKACLHFKLGYRYKWILKGYNRKR